jgi:trk system potassium uptake protein TrkA
MIIVGAGSIGTSLIEIAASEKNNVVVVDANSERARELSTKYDITVLSGNATAAETLREAGSERADALIVTTGDDAVNLMVVSIAVDLGIPSVVSIVNDPEHAEFFRKLGANVMENPEQVVASHLYNAVKRPNIQDFAMLSQGEQVFRLHVSEESPLVERSIAESRQRGTIPETLRVLSIDRDNERFIPDDSAIIVKGDVLTLFSLERVSDELIGKLIG